MKYKIVIFDLDGVILSTDQLHYKAWKSLADKENIYFDEKINNSLRGVNRVDSLKEILKRTTKTYTTEEFNNLMDYKNALYVESLKTLTENDVFEGVRETLKELKNNKILIAIGSSSKNAKNILKQIKLIDEFDYISDGNMITRGKPFPDVFLNVSNHFNINPEECLVVEDATSGIKAAKAANMAAVGIKDATTSNLTDYKLNDITDLLKIVKE